MGLIKAALSSISSTLHDQWKDIISCPNMENEVLMQMVTTDTGAITKQSIIRVMPGQCAVIMHNGKILDATAEEGDYNFDENLEPSFFAGNFGEVFKQMWQRFTFGGGVPNKQVVYYFNIKEIMDNKFGTSAPIPYQDWSHPVPNQMTGGMLPLSVKVKCFGKYTFKISDPALFMKEIAGTATIYKKDDITEQIRTEVISAFQNILNELGTEKYKVPVLELPSQTDEIKEMMEERIYDEPVRKRGLSIVTFAVESVTLDEKSEEYINNYILSANANMQQGTLTGAYAEAVKNAASNANGAANGFMGVGMMNMAGGGVFGAATQNAANNAANNTINNNVNDTEINAQDDAKNNEKEETKKTEEAPKPNTWTCQSCGQENKGNFCMQCGKQKPKEKVCSNCGEKLEEGAMFCPECGTKCE